MTDMTIIKIATPSIIPTKEKTEIIFKKPSFFLGLRFLDEINLSIFVNNFYALSLDLMFSKLNSSLFEFNSLNSNLFSSDFDPIII